MSWLPFVDTIVDKLIPDAGKRAELKLKAAELQQAGELGVLDKLMQVDLAQARINEADARSNSKFQAWGRPAALWVCVFGLAYPIFTSLLTWFLQLAIFFGADAAMIKAFPAAPQIDTGALMTLLLGLLGLGTQRTVERLNRFKKN